MVRPMVLLKQYTIFINYVLLVDLFIENSSIKNYRRKNQILFCLERKAKEFCPIDIWHSSAKFIALQNNTRFGV